LVRNKEIAVTLKNDPNRTRPSNSWDIVFVIGVAIAVFLVSVYLLRGPTHTALNNVGGLSASPSTLVPVPYHRLDRLEAIVPATKAKIVY
jgi:hypothetical protein